MEEKQFIIEFIELYHSLPALWDIKSKEYSDRAIKNIQYETLLVKYRERYPDAGKKELTQKINSLRTNYRRVLKRITSLEKSGDGVCVENDSNLYYFDAMNFLRDNETPCTSHSSNETQLINDTQDYTEPRKRKRSANANEELIKLVTKRLKQPKDEYESACKTWAAKLKKMNDTQRIFAEKFVNDVLFEGQLGTLHRHSMQLNVLNRSSPTSAVENDYTMISPQTLSPKADIKIENSNTANDFTTFV